MCNTGAVSSDAGGSDAGVARRAGGLEPEPGLAAVEWWAAHAYAAAEQTAQHARVSAGVARCPVF